METLRVDFNRNRNGFLLSSLSRASGPIEVGDRVEVYQPGEADMTSRAQVVSVSGSGQVRLSLIDGRLDDLSTEFMTDLVSWHVEQSNALAQPSASYYPVNPQNQTWPSAPLRQTPVSA